MRGGRIQIPLEAGHHWSSSKHHLMALGWHADDGPTLNAGLVAFRFSRDTDQYCLETLYFCDVQGGGGPDPMSPPLSESALADKQKDWSIKL